MTDRTELSRPRDQVAGDIQHAIHTAREINSRPISTEADVQELELNFRTWRDTTYRILERSFTTEELAQEFRPRPTYMLAPGSIQSLTSQVRAITNAHLSKLETIEATLHLFSNPPDQVPTGRARDGKKVFIVHGHSPIRHEVARLVESLGCEVVILDETPNLGSPTLIEKLERSFTDVGYAIVLLTGDDEGRVRGTEEPLRLRARQNVVAELGYVTSHLGRSRVTVIYEVDVEFPSDFSGIAYTPLDAAGAWKYKLSDELRAAGIV